MTTQEPISPELQARIDALPEGGLKNRVVRAPTGAGIRSARNEEIFENIIQSAAEANAQRDKWRQWRDDEVAEFANHFKHELPEDYAEFLRQERQNGEIDSDLSWKVEKLSEKWITGLASIDYILLLGKLREHIQSIMTTEGKNP